MSQPFPLPPVQDCRWSQTPCEVEHQGSKEKLLESSKVSRDQEEEASEAESQALGECATRAEAVRC